MKCVYKYPLTFTDHQTIQMPDGAEVLAVHEQDGRLCLWALVDPSQYEASRHFAIHGTGHPIQDEAASYIGTALTHEGSLVWHVFEVPG